MSGKPSPRLRRPMHWPTTPITAKVHCATTFSRPTVAASVMSVPKRNAGSVLQFFNTEQRPFPMLCLQQPNNPWLL
jgi:hypothetical protein